MCVLKLFENAHFLFPEEQNKKEEKNPQQCRRRWKQPYVT